jgi:serine-type D-Ala-D-Ala carboxypeptidase (penicillin-binding protein 5/6)
VIIAAILTTVYVARTRMIAFNFQLQSASAPNAKAFDRFDFSYYWIATHGQPNLPIHGQAAFLVDLDARQVLWQRDAETSRAPASLTKMITAMVAVDDAGSLTTMVAVTSQATNVVPSVMGLTPGESVSVKDLLYGLFLDSGNDAAEALASGIVPRDRFLRQMNQKAKSIGLTASHFVTPSGLDAPGHGMSAHDLAHAAAYLETYYPQLAAIAATRDIAIPATSTHKAFYPHNLNPLLWSFPGATGLKTGLTDTAGGCIVATATRGHRHLIAVVLNATLHSAADATTLLNYGFSVEPTRAFGPWASTLH